MTGDGMENFFNAYQKAYSDFICKLFIIYNLYFFNGTDIVRNWKNKVTCPVLY